VRLLGGDDDVGGQLAHRASREPHQLFLAVDEDHFLLQVRVLADLGDAGGFLTDAAIAFGFTATGHGVDDDAGFASDCTSFCHKQPLINPVRLDARVARDVLLARFGETGCTRFRVKPEECITGALACKEVPRLAQLKNRVYVVPVGFKAKSRSLE
jgi:hypothetical protein